MAKKPTPPFVQPSTSELLSQGFRLNAPIEEAPAEVKAPTTRTWGEALTDTGRGVLGGVGGLISGAGTVAGMLPGGNMDNAVVKFGDSTRKYWEDGQSAALKQKKEDRSKAIDAADGQWEKAGTAFWETVSDPALLLDTAASNVTTLIPGMAAGRLASAAKMARGMRAGPLSVAGSEALANAAGTLGTRVAIGTGAVQQGADVSGELYKSAMKKTNDEWMQNPEFMAQLAQTDGSDQAIHDLKSQYAQSASRAAFLPAAGISVFANKFMPGGDMLERALVGGAARDTIKAGTKYAVPKAMAKSTLGEPVQEFVEEGGGKRVANAAMQSYVDPSQDSWEGVGENAGMGAAGGFGMGMVGGALHREQGATSQSSNTAAQAAAAQAAQQAAAQQAAQQAAALAATQAAAAQQAAALAATQAAAQQPGAVASRAAVAGNAAQIGYTPPTHTVFANGTIVPASNTTPGEQAVFDQRFIPQPTGDVTDVEDVSQARATTPTPAAQPIEQAAPIEQVTAPIPEAPLTRAPDIATGPARVLQNRDRSTAASIGQMNDIASAPDYLRAGQSRVMDSGAPVVFGAAPSSALMGKQQQIADGHGARVPVQYAVVEAADVLPSHQADGTPIAQYQQGVPGQLRAVAGNGRAAGITEAYRRGTTAQYRQDLIDDAPDLGVDPEAISAMSAPMLVRVMPEEHVTDDIGDRSNISGTAALSATEQAANDTKRLDMSALSFDEVGMPDRQSVAKFVYTMPVGERGAMMQPDGSPTRQAIDRITSAAFKAAYGNDELVSLQAQSTDPEIRNIITALANVAGPMAGLEGAGDLDIRGAVSEAAQMAVNAKRLGIPLADYLNNADMGFSGEAFVVAKFMADNIRSAKRMAEGLRAWVDYVAEQVAIARDNQAQDGFFGATPTASRNDVFNQLGATNEQANTSTTPLQNGASGPSRVTNSPQWQEAQPIAEPSGSTDSQENNAQEVAQEAAPAEDLNAMFDDLMAEMAPKVETGESASVQNLVKSEPKPLDQAEKAPEKQAKASKDVAQADAGESKANSKPNELSNTQYGQAVFDGLQTLRPDLNQDDRVALALLIDKTIKEEAPANWKGDQPREAQLANALFATLNRDRDLTKAVFEIIKDQTPAPIDERNGKEVRDKAKGMGIDLKDADGKFKVLPVLVAEIKAKEEAAVAPVAAVESVKSEPKPTASQSSDEPSGLLSGDWRLAAFHSPSEMPTIPGIYRMREGTFARFDHGIWWRTQLTPKKAMLTEFSAADQMTPKNRYSPELGWVLHAEISKRDPFGEPSAMKVVWDKSSTTKKVEIGEPADAFLQAPTPEEVVARQDKAEAAAKAEAAQRRAQDERDRLERERKDIAKASQAAADTFELGGDAEQNLSGQGDIVGKAPTTLEAAKPQADTKRTNPTPITIPANEFVAGNLSDYRGSAHESKDHNYVNVDESAAKDVSGFASENSAIIAWKQLGKPVGAVLVPFRFSDGSYSGKYADAKTRYSLFIPRTKAAPQEQQKPAPKPVEASPKPSTQAAEKPQVKANTIFTEDAAAAARARLKAKLGRLNSGIDPEMLMDGITLAGYHIEQGARTFTAYAKAMIEDLGDGVKPYLKSWYMGVKYDPRASGFDGMDSAASVDSFDVESRDEITDHKLAQLDNGQKGESNAAQQLDSNGARPLGGVSPTNVRPDGSSGDIGAVPDGSRRGDSGGDGLIDSPAFKLDAGVGDGAGAASIPAGGVTGGRKNAEKPRVLSATGVAKGLGNTGRAGGINSESGANPAPNAPPIAAPQPLAQDFTISDELELGEGGQKTKFKANVAAIRLMQELESSGRMATQEEQAVLAKYVGWGALPQAFDEANSTWAKEHAEITALMSPEDLALARQSTRYAHYTSREIIQDGIYAAMRRFGFTGGKTLEAGAGVGNFIGLMPADMRSAGRFTAIEREPFSSAIARQLYPQQSVQRADFTQFKGNDAYFDAAVGNPPFASDPQTDLSGRKHLSGLSLHNYFFAKSIDMLREGGILAQVVTSSFLDTKGDRARKYMSDRVEFLGAIRLPNNAFSKNAGTEVTTDIIFLRKLPESKFGSKATREDAKRWLNAGNYTDRNGRQVPLNQYFIDNPGMMLGDFGAYGTMYGPLQPALVAKKGQDTLAMLKLAVGKLPANVYQSIAQTSSENQISAAVVALKNPPVKEGGYFVEGEKLMQRIPDIAGEARGIEITPDTQWTAKMTLGQSGFERIKELSAMRATVRGLIAAEMNDDTDAMQTLRATLNKQYDAYRDTHGLINDVGTLRVFDDDPDFPLLASLEHGYTPSIGAAAAKRLGINPTAATAQKGPIFTQRVVASRQTVQKVETPADALDVSMAERGKLDTAYIGNLLGMEPDAVLKELSSGEKPLLFLDPSSNEYVLRDAYLSGNVRAKLAQAQASNMFANATALEAVQPKDVASHEITARLGSPWIPTEVYQEFARSLYGSEAKVSVTYVPANSSFGLEIRGATEVALKNTWGTKDVLGDVLLQAIMNNRSIKVTERDSNGKVYTNVEATEAANEKALQIKEKFNDWLFADANRSEVLVKAYNETNNNYVTRVYDGSHMMFPGKVPDSIVKFRRHQRNAIARIVQDRTTLLDHVVGAGKTYTVIAGAMELKRTGLARKSMVAVPNHLVKQWAADFYRLYPGANILTATKKDFQKANRRKFLAKIATGDWDAVVIAHSSFGFIKPSPEFELDFNGREIAKIMAVIQSAKDGDGDKKSKARTIKQLEGMKERLENRIRSLRDKPMDDLLDFEQLGVDQLFVDEAHLFKNLMYSTKMQGVSGLNDPTGSQRAYDMYVKTNQVLEKNGRGQGVVFATGTPISNSMAEMYHMMRYLMPQQMRELGFESFDAWANTYASVEQVWMQAPSGDGFKAQNRMSNFVNTPELLKMFDQVSDTVTMDDIKKAYSQENGGAEFPLPKIKGGRRTPVSLIKSEAQNDYMKEIAERAKALEQRKGPPEKGADNILVVMGDARKAAMDIRLVRPDITEREKGGRIDLSTDAIVERYKKYNSVKGTQLVFSDLGTPLKQAKKELAEYEKLQARISAGTEDVATSAALGNESAMDIMEDAEAAQAELAGMGSDWLSAIKTALRGFSIYDDSKAALIEKGIPEHEIAFIHDFNTDEQKAGLFRKVNAGQIRVLIGSTAKLGAGTNVQERLVALHHLDVPWRPSDVEQREGRIERQGNKLMTEWPNFEAEILAYVTQDTLDMRMWQVQETKLKMINQLRTRKIGREIDNAFEDMELSAGEMQAAATGDINLLKEIQLRSDVKKLEQRQRSFDGQRNDLINRKKRNADRLASIPPKLNAALEELSHIRNYRVDLLLKKPTFKLNIDGVDYTDASAAQAVLRKLDEASESVTDLAGEVTQKKLPLSVTIDGQLIKNRTTMAQLYTAAVGDADPIMWSFNGKTYFRRAEIIEAIRSKVREANAEKSQQEVGSVGPYSISVEGQFNRAGTKIFEIALSRDGAVRMSNTVDATNLEAEPTTVLSQVAYMLDSVEPSANYFANSLEHEKKEGAELDKLEVPQEWPEQHKLTEARDTHRAILATLKKKSASELPFADGKALILSPEDYRSRSGLEPSFSSGFVVVSQGLGQYRNSPAEAFATYSDASAWIESQIKLSNEGKPVLETPKFSRSLPDVSDPRTGISTALLELGQADNLFQHPRSDALYPEHIAEDKSVIGDDGKPRTIKVLPVDRSTDDPAQWMLANTTPKDDDATDTRSWMLKTPTGKWATLTKTNGTVYINVSGVGEGNGGSAIYDLAANFALNNGLTFVGDPNGVSPAAMRRRLENMLSSAIKYGTTDHLQPHPDQYLGDASIGVPELDWKKGDTLGNIRSMIDVSIGANAFTNPFATALIHYDPATQSFADESGRLDAERLSKVLGFDDRTEGTGQAGDTTLRRNALFQSLLQSVGNRTRFVAQIHSEQNRGGTGVGSELEKTFYSRGSSPGKLGVALVQASANSLTRHWANAPEVVVLSSMDDARVPQAVRDEDARQRSQGASGSPEGFVHEGVVYLVADQLPTAADVKRVLMHETLGHVGLRGVFGDGLNQVLNQVAMGRRADVSAKAAQYGLDMTDPAQRLDAAEEMLAEMAQANPQLGFVKRAVSAIRNWLRAHGFSRLKLTDADIVQAYILPARGWVERGGGAGAMRSPALSRGQGGQIDTPAFKKWFGDSKVVDADGKPLVVYHGVKRADMRIENGEVVFSPKFNIFRADGIIEPGIFFSPNKAVAASYGTPVAFYLKAENLIRNESPLSSVPVGHDGIYRMRGKGDSIASAYEVAVFEPEQIKLAFGNNGDFDPTNPDIRFSRSTIVGQTARVYSADVLAAMQNTGMQVEVPTLQERAKALWKDAGKKLTQGIVDQFSPVKELSQDAYRLLRMSKGASGAFEALMHGGRLKLTDGVYDIDRTQRGGAVEKLFKPMQGEHHDFLRWVAANRAERLLGDGREHLFTQQDIDALKTLADGTLNHAYTLKNGPRAGQTTTDRREMYQDSLVTFNEFNTNMLDMAEQSGLINADGRKDWESEFYVPFYRAMQEDGSGVVGGNIKSGVVRQQAFKHLKGGTDKLNADLLDNTLMNWAHLLDASAKNRAALATLEAAQNMGVAIEASADVARDIGKATHNRNGVVWAMDEGVQRYFVVDDPYILTALTSLEYAGMRNPVMNAMGTMKRLLTIGVTASPFFKVRNLIRDSVQAIGVGDMSYNIGSNLKEGWKLTDPKSDAYFSLLASGGTIHFGSMYEGNESKRIQALVESGVDRDTILNDPYHVKNFYRKAIEPGLTWYNELGNRGEAINRAALYNHLVKKGVSHAEAALQARDLMDFSMQGAFTSIRFLTQVVPFMNARLQGLYKLGKSAKQNPQRFTAVLGAVAAVSLYLLAAYGDDDDWKRRDESDRNNFWWFKVGGKAYRIPKPFEIGAIATLAERGFELAFDKEMTGKRFRGQVLKLLGDNLSMNPTPQLIKPMLDVYANLDSFTGRPIESMGMERLKAEYRYNDRTSMTARGLSTAMNSATGLLGKETLSPVEIDHMLRGYFGWLGSLAVGIVDLMARPATGQVDQASRDLWKTATGNIASDLRDAPSRYVSQMYEQSKEIERAYGTWRELQKTGKTQEAQEFRAEHLDELRQYHRIEAIKKRASQLNQQARIVERSATMPPEQKRERLRALSDQRNALAKSLV